MAQAATSRCSWRTHADGMHFRKLQVLPAKPPRLLSAIAQAEKLLSMSYMKRAQSYAHQQLAPFLELVQDERRLDEALAFGILT
eukprot:CAMPEP_0119333896 /NCGR_PEP_ID=MMETSP1333-20130426/86208_1 /TAXON_ID=418940 /ORGANISM="Scyphosphaera apsteinii, Strain RCC1455" /LENGTH=83 /DNA_ID=CAMNT_0007344073 /DNA_START=24 /DNA_END=271 /DNA_ORIENTATION=-